MPIADPSHEFFKDGGWAWNTSTLAWEKLTITDGKLRISSVAEAHHATHEDGGDDEISVAALSGELADDQPPKAHALGGAKHSADTLANLNTKVSDATLDDSADTRDPNAHAASHQNGGGDEISVAALSGLLADGQTPLAHDLGGAAHGADTLANLNTKVSDATLDDSGDTRDPNTHAASHQNGGGDEISVAALSGLLADGQTPLGHKASHAGGGGDKLKYTRQVLWFIPDATLTTGTDKSATIVYRGPTLTLIRWDFRAKTAPTGAALIADVNVAGTSLWDSNQGNRPTIAAGQTSGTDTSFDTASLADGDVLTLDVDQIGSTIAGGQITVILEGEANLETD